MYRELKKLSVRWEPYEGEGLEHLTLYPVREGLIARGVIVGEDEAQPFGVSYTIECDAEWRVRAFDIRTTDGRGLGLNATEPGRWVTHQGENLAQFDGCIDIDLAGTPFTNTLPIRRLALQPKHGQVELSMLYFSFEDFRPSRDGQRYTCLEAGRRFLYEAADGTFEAEIEVDEDGLVRDYPPLYRRVWKELA